MFENHCYRQIRSWFIFLLLSLPTFSFLNFLFIYFFLYYFIPGFLPVSVCLFPFLLSFCLRFDHPFLFHSIHVFNLFISLSFLHFLILLLSFFTSKFISLCISLRHSCLNVDGRQFEFRLQYWLFRGFRDILLSIWKIITKYIKSDMAVPSTSFLLQYSQPFEHLKL
jgi:hypothetical protein